MQFRLRASSDSSNGDVNNLVGKERDGWMIDYSGEKPMTPLLDTVNFPIHMKNLSLQVEKPLGFGNFCNLFFVFSYEMFFRILSNLQQSLEPKSCSPYRKPEVI